MLTLSLLLAPLALAGAAVLAYGDPGPRPRRALRATRAATAVALAVAALAIGLAAVGPLIGPAGVVRADALAAVMVALVALLGAVVLQFSRNYLDGDPRQGRFLGDLALVVACVLVLVMTGDLIVLVLAWIASSLALHRLLRFYAERPGARIAARKKFVVARLGDVALVAAAALLVHHAGASELGAIAAAADGSPAVVTAAALIAVTAVLKAAQFPTHGWLIEMQEAPTPVSALLHAGILNGGTFLVVRLAAVVQEASWVLVGLAVVGAVTAAFASIVMVTDPRVKATLAWSSAAHMGFMLLLCGLGAYPVAIAHLVAHSVYKAHAFLTSGTAVETARATRLRSAPVGLARIALAFAIAALLVGGAATALGFDVLATPTSLALALLVAITLAHLVACGSRGALAWTLAAAAAVALAFYVLERAGGRAFADAIPAGPTPSPIVVAAVASAFAIVVVLQLWRPRAWPAAYVWARNGLYANAYFDRLVGAYRAPRTATPPPAIVAAPPRPLAASVVTAAVARATRTVAPVWPLETFVAVNPFLGLADRPVGEAARFVARTAGARMTMPRAFYADALATGRLARAHLAAALADAHARGEADLPADVDALVRTLAVEPPAPTLVPTVADVVAARTGRAWDRLVVERLGAWAATYFDAQGDAGHASWRSPFRAARPYAAFRAEAALDRTPELHGARGFRATIAALPADADAAIAHSLARLAIPERALDLYLARLLATIGGWAAHARQRGWARELAGDTDPTVAELLAIRLAWEVALLEAFAADAAWAAARATLADAPPPPALDLVVQDAYERAWQGRLLDELQAPPRARTGRPDVHAAFCIDVRSEVMRRALEHVAPRVETIGFAGFFGFPIAFAPLGDDHAGARCPVLLAPRATVGEVAATPAATARLADERGRARRIGHAWRSFKASAIACFGFVGPVGLAALPALVRDALGRTPAPAGDDRVGPDATVLPLADRVAMAEGLLRGMSLTSGFARLVVLVGHGATTANNPHAAGLACGACGGHAGDVNARLAARVLNDADVRRELAARGLALPDDTVAVAALHDTTTDRVTILDRATVPASHAVDLARLEAQLADAGARARRARAPRLGEDPGAPDLDRRVIARAHDGSQVRPEWGLAGCAAFVVAPRARTAGLDLDGRAFLHSYDWRADAKAGYPVLELVMTAPMVVASWINLQYYASTVDNRVYGCGNKVLHNVVGTLGVLEGNGGDLRVGLPWQSVHDGARVVHEPMRLAVVLEAPVAAITAVLAKHAHVRALADHGWLHLVALDDAGAARRYLGDLRWDDAPAGATLAA